KVEQSSSLLLYYPFLPSMQLLDISGRLLTTTEVDDCGLLNGATRSLRELPKPCRVPLIANSMPSCVQSTSLYDELRYVDQASKECCQNEQSATLATGF